MGQYDKFKKLILPSNIVKPQLTSTIPGSGRTMTVAGQGNEGIDMAVWFQERIDDNSIIITTPSVSGLITLTGLPANSTNLGTFSSIISDNSTIVDALQDIVTYIENLTLGQNGIYGGSGSIPSSTVATITDYMSFAAPASASFIVNIGELSGSNLLINETNAKLKYYDLASTNEVIVDSSGVKIKTLTPDGLIISGLDARYDIDYSAYYTNRSLVDKEYVDSKVFTLTIGEGLIGDGTPSSPLEWAGAFTSAPITGSGTSFFPFTIANNSITSGHIRTGTILFSNWNQNSATTGQVPQWNGTNWVSSTIVGSLPAGSTGSVLIHNGTNYISATLITETQIGTTGSTMTIAATPLSFAQLTIYKNGQYLTITDDFTISGATLTFTTPLLSTDKTTVLYYI